VKRIALGGNGVDARWFSKLEEDKRYEGSFMGRVERGKGVDTLLLAWRGVVAKIPHARVVIIGSMDPADEREFRGMIRQSALEENVVFAGYVSDSEAESLMRSSRIFIFPSRREGFGLAVAEAMAAGVPCIVSDIPALVENFASAAVVVPVEDHYTLANEILALLDDEAKSQSIARTGRELASKMDWDQICVREAKLIRETLSKKNR